MGYSLQRPRAPRSSRLSEIVRMFCFNGLLTSTPTRTRLYIVLREIVPGSFQWATHFNAHAHHPWHQRHDQEGRRLVSMGYSLQRPRAQSKTLTNVLCLIKFQWATHFNAHAHGNTNAKPKTLAVVKFQWATHFNAHAHAVGPIPVTAGCVSVGFNGLLTSTPTRTLRWKVSRK